jgi:hypothetical protein
MAEVGRFNCALCRMDVDGITKSLVIFLGDTLRFITAETVSFCAPASCEVEAIGFVLSLVDFETTTSFAGFPTNGTL